MMTIISVFFTTAPPLGGRLAQLEESIRRTQPEPCENSYLNPSKTGGRSTRAVLATFYTPLRERRRARGAGDPSTRVRNIGSSVRLAHHAPCRDSESLLQIQKAQLITLLSRCDNSSVFSIQEGDACSRCFR